MKHRGLLIILVVFLLTAVAVQASSSIGLTPPRKSYFMLPGESTSDSFRILYYEPYPSIARIQATGTIAKYVKLQTNEIRLPAGGPGTTISYSIDFPEDMRAKTSLLGDIRVELLPPPEEFQQSGATGAFAAIGMLINVDLPRPGKYLHAKFQPVKHVNVGEIVYFTLDIRNMGTDNLDQITGTIDIFDARDNLVTSVPTGDTQLSSGEEGNLFAYWETNGAPPSHYKATARITFGGEKDVQTKTEFLVGDLVVNILSVDVNTTRREVTKFDIGLESLWNAQINNVFAEITVKNETGNLVGVAKSTSEDVPRLGTQSLTAYFDSGHLPRGEYDANIRVHYAEKKAEKVVPFSLVGDATRDRPAPIPFGKMLFSGTNALLAILVLLLATMLIFLLYSRKKEHTQNTLAPATATTVVQTQAVQQAQSMGSSVVMQQALPAAQPVHVAQQQNMAQPQTQPIAAQPPAQPQPYGAATPQSYTVPQVNAQEQLQPTVQAAPQPTQLPEQSFSHDAEGVDAALKKLQEMRL